MLNFKNFFGRRIYTSVVSACIIFMPTFSLAKKAEVIVDLNDIIANQNPLLYGGNNIYPKGAQGLLNKDGKLDPTTVEIAKQLGLRTYRFPGGSEANLYKWKRAIGPLEERIDNVSGNNRGNRSNEFGSDEFGRLLETTGFDQGIIMVAFGYEKPEDAADWVEYMNSKVGENPNGGIDWAAVRARNGHLEPYGIKYWEIGNEVYGNWELNWGSYPDELDAKRGRANVEKDDAAGTNGVLPFGDAYRYVHGGERYFKRQKAAGLSTWKGEGILANGKPHQKFYAKFPPINISDEKKPLIVEIAGKRWSRVENFSSSSKTDLHYRVDTQSGEITFGDGEKGALPPIGKPVILSYRSGPQPGFKHYYEKMKEVDPSIVIISCFEKQSFYKRMQEAKLPYDGVAKHLYPNIISKAKKEDKYEASVVFGHIAANKINEHREFMHKYRHDGLTGNEKLWMTEYQIRNHVNQLAIFHEVVNNQMDFVATLLGHSLFLNNNTPMITDEGVIRSRALPVMIYSRYLGDMFVKTTTSGDKNTYKKYEFDSVLSSAGRSEDGKSVGVVITNTSSKKDVDVTVSINGLIEGIGYTVESISLRAKSKDPLKDNTVNDPQNIWFRPAGSVKLENGKAQVKLDAAETIILQIKPTD